MAVLCSKINDYKMILRPDRITEVGRPTWILVQLEMKEGHRTLTSTTFSVTKGDLAELESGLDDICSGRRNEFTITTMDDNFILYATHLESLEDVAVGFWTGEPYALMVGYRFVSTDKEIRSFIEELQSDEKAILPPNQLR